MSKMNNELTDNQVGWMKVLVILLITTTLVFCAKVGCDELKKPVVAQRTNAPLLTKLSPEDEVVSKTIPPPLGKIYPFKEPATLSGFVSGSLETNVMTVPVNDEIFQIVTVTAKMVIQAPWENMMLQWNYDKPVDAQTNRYKLVR